jgi:hypothetical protein
MRAVLTYLAAVQKEAAGSDCQAKSDGSLRIMQEGGTDDLAEVVGNARLATSFRIEVMRDGVAAFSDPARAAAFRNLLVADGHLEVLVSEVDSDALFREATGPGRGGVVVLMADEGYLPRPAQLAAALRRKRSFEDL